LLLYPLLNAAFGHDAALSPPSLTYLFYSLLKGEVQPWEETWPYCYTPSVWFMPAQSCSYLCGFGVFLPSPSFVRGSSATSLCCDGSAPAL